MTTIFYRRIQLAAAAAILLAISASPALSQGVTDTLKEQAKQRGMEELQKRTGVTIPGQPSTPTQQGSQTAPMPTPGDGTGKVLVWGVPGTKLYYYEGEAGYGMTAGGRCMIEKDAKQNGLQAATKRKGK
jgi:hypothetical protein